jgi:hypothetical protein
MRNTSGKAEANQGAKPKIEKSERQKLRNLTSLMGGRGSLAQINPECNI